MKTIQLFFIAMSLYAIRAPAEAENSTCSISGTITEVGDVNSLLSNAGIAPGYTFTGSFTYDKTCAVLFRIMGHRAESV